MKLAKGSALKLSFRTTLIYLRYPSPLLWLFAIETEIRKLGSSNRVKNMFEKAVENTEYVNSLQHLLFTNNNTERGTALLFGGNTLTGCWK